MIAHALQLGDEAVAAAGVVVGPADEPVGAEVDVVGLVVQQMPGDHEDRVPYRQRCFLLSDPSGQSPELRREIAVALA